MNKIETIKDFMAGKLKNLHLASFWGHFYKEEQNWETLLAKTIEFQKTYEWDFVKINPSSTYIVEEWGNRYKKFDDRKQETLEYRIKHPDDFFRLPKLNLRSGLLGDHLLLIKGLRSELRDVPLVMTIFSPLSYAGRLCGSPEKLAAWIKEGCKLVHDGIKMITDFVIEYSETCIQEGCHGIFYATTEWGSRDLLNSIEYEKFGVPYDIKILDMIKSKGAFTILHVCRQNNRLRDILHYPVEALSWDANNRSNPSLHEIARTTGKAVVGGISQDFIEDARNINRIKREIEDFYRDLAEYRAILAPGCTFSKYNEEVLKFIKKNVKM